MKTTVNEYDFRRAFEALRPNNFSYNGLGAIFEWFEEYEDSTGEEVELDVIAICCAFSEYTLEELKSEYGNYHDLDNWDDMDDVCDYFNDHIMVIPVDDDRLLLMA